MKCKLRPETLYLTVNIIDRYLSVRKVARSRLQLVGVVALFIASKFEEINPPKAAELTYITDNTYTKLEVLDLECTMLAALDFKFWCLRLCTSWNTSGASPTATPSGVQW